MLPLLALPSIGTLTINVSNFLAMHPALVNEIAGHGLAHILYSHVRRTGGGRSMSRRQSRKLCNRKRRWFVDNIIMHHKRLHDRNREMVIKDARSRALARRQNLEKKPALTNSLVLQKDNSQASRWKERLVLRQRGLELRDRSEAKKLRAHTRWASIMELQQSDNPEGF